MAEKDPIAVELGRRGGLKGGKAVAAKRSPYERSEFSRRASFIRWGKPLLPPTLDGVTTVSFMASKSKGRGRRRWSVFCMLWTEKDEDAPEIEIDNYAYGDTPWEALAKAVHKAYEHYGH